MAEREASDVIRVGLTQPHGMVLEASAYAPPNIEYTVLEAKPERFKVIRSPIQGYLSRYFDDHVDVVEAVIRPVRTLKPWIFSIECVPAANAFSLLGLPLPRLLRFRYLEQLFLRGKCAALAFWSNAGMETLHNYGKGLSREVLDMSTVVYPGVRCIDESAVEHADGDSLNLLFSGDFFRKGGVNVVDAFETLQRKFDGLKLRLCCDPQIDFITNNQKMRDHYLKRIEANPAITLGRVPRSQLIESILPATDIFVSPTYFETFGFAILEAMAYGKPIVTTNHFAIPELLTNGVNGYMVDTAAYDYESMFPGYRISVIPDSFRHYVTDSVIEFLSRLIESKEERVRLGKAALQTARDNFSFERRNSAMRALYDRAMGL